MLSLNPLLQSGALAVFFRDYGVADIRFPVYSKLRVVEGYAVFRLRAVIIVTLVLEFSFRAQQGESVGEASRNKELSLVFVGELHSNVFAECGRAFAQIHRYIKNAAFHHPHKLGLSMLAALKMQTAHHRTFRIAFVVLNKVYISHFTLKNPFFKTFKEVSPRIVKHTRLYNFNSLYCRLRYLHSICILFLQHAAEITTIFIFAIRSAEAFSSSRLIQPLR